MSKKNKRRLCLLVVDDDPAIRYSLSRWLGKRGVRVIEAADTREAVEMVRDASFIDAQIDGLLVDYQLPDATGCRIIMEFRDEFPGVPMALMTGREDLSLELWLRARGIPLLRKPLNLGGLGKWLQEIGRRATAVPAS
jgi:two-component system OmpR family response regulator